MFNLPTSFYDLLFVCFVFISSTPSTSLRVGKFTPSHIMKKKKKKKFSSDSVAWINFLSSQSPVNCNRSFEEADVDFSKVLIKHVFKMYKKIGLFSSFQFFFILKGKSEIFKYILHLSRVKHGQRWGKILVTKIVMYHWKVICKLCVWEPCSRWSKIGSPPKQIHNSKWNESIQNHDKHLKYL